MDRKVVVMNAGTNVENFDLDPPFRRRNRRNRHGGSVHAVVGIGGGAAVQGRLGVPVLRPQFHRKLRHLQSCDPRQQESPILLGGGVANRISSIRNTTDLDLCFTTEPVGGNVFRAGRYENWNQLPF
ncbi:hypothetical protein [Streptomyces sp. H27-H5]|uniref:hypothetical protein n=1 Tax=Streptomyces sp. H27-H5 TaxID=2996460 RepID=UPI0022707785|nr:hypothetical protein [Streptomyces sp. H27-H5]MCY0962075.1 hypothetical protein [Streptomyces sp. H27-H5]